jgi:hypothetical protein
MDFLKKNYEKILLSVVLLGLVVAVAFLPLKISSEKQKMEDMSKSLVPKPKPLPPVDMTKEDATLKLMAGPPTVDFGPPNRLFNPMLWQKAADGHLIKADSTNIGPNALVITKLTPLFLKLSLDNITVLDTGTRYVIGTERQAAANPKDRPHKQTYCSIGTKGDVFTLHDVKVTPDNQTNVVLELHDTGENVTVGKDKPYERIDSYMVDLKYPPENKIFPPARRVGATIEFNDETYKIVAITTNELVLSATSNQKKWTVSHATSPTP